MDEQLLARAEALRRRAAEACLRAGRDPASVRILPVSKTLGPERIRDAADAGFDVFGENKVQEAQAKIPMCPSRLEWHLVGRLQSNKARPAARLFSTVHSVDSLALLERLDAAAGEAGVRLTVLLQVNVSGERSKTGFAPAEAAEAARRANALPRLVLAGLMTIPPADPDPEAARPYFRNLRELRDRLRDETGAPLPELSMGMSHDFETAIEEGATWVRIGAALFGARPAGRPA